MANKSRFSIFTEFTGVDRLSRVVERMQTRLDKFTQITQARLEKVNSVAGKFGDMLKKAAVIGTGALVVTAGAMTDVVATGAQFEQTIVSAVAKFPGEVRKGTAAFDELKNAARETGRATEFNASQSAEALNFLAMAGFDAKSSIAALPGVVDLATSAGIDLASATDVASDSLGAFNLATKDSVQLGKNLARINDVLAKTSTTANTSIEDLFESIKEGAPVATNAGASVETYATLAGKLANAGIKASRSGTTLKNLFLTLSAPTAGAAKVLERLGVTTVDSGGDMRDVIDILGDLGKSLDGLGTAEKSGVLDSIFGKIPIAGVNVLLNEGSEELRKYREQLENAAGASSAMAGVMRDTVQGRLDSFQSAIESVKISIFEMNEGPLADVIQQVTEWTRANEGLIASEIGGFLAFLIENFETIVETGKRVLIVVGVFVTLMGILKTFIAIMTAVNLVMAANPVSLIVIGVMALIAAVAALTVYWDEVWDKIEAVGNAVSKIPGFGFLSSEDEEESESTSGQLRIVAPEETLANRLEEKRTLEKSEITIRDETGRAEVTRGDLSSGLTILETGMF